MLLKSLIYRFVVRNYPYFLKVTIMNRFEQRARELQPAIYLTLGGIIQSLALGFLLSRAFTEDAVLDLRFWVQFVTALLILILVWHEYAVGLIAFSWTWSVIDSAVPFLLGIAEFFLISRLAAPDLSGWLLAMSGLSAAALASLLNQYIRASGDPANKPAWDSIERLRKTSVVSSLGLVFIFGIGSYITQGRTISNMWHSLGLIGVLVVVVVFLIISHMTLERVSRLKSTTAVALPAPAPAPTASPAECVVPVVPVHEHSRSVSNE